MILFLTLIFLVVYTLWIPLTILKYISPNFHQKFLQKTGISHEFLSTTIITTLFSKMITDFGRSKTKLFSKIYSVGVYICLTCSILSMSYFIFNIITFVGSFFFVQMESISKEAQHVVVLVPGVTIPFLDIPILATSLFLCAIFHELGHALAAASEDVEIFEFGLNFYIILPSAYISMSSDDIDQKNSFQKLKIFTAGAFHNIIMGIFIILLFLFLFQSEKHTIVTNIKPNSPLQTKLNIGDKILTLDGEKIQDNWIQSLKMIKNKNQGYCIEKGFFEKKERSLLCCENEETSELCISHDHIKGCIKPRELIQKNRCDNDCTDREICFRPRDFLFEIETSNEKSILYHGTIQSLFNECNLE